MYGPPLQRQRFMSAKSTSISQAVPQRRELPRQSAHAVVRTFAHQLRTLVAAGIDSGAHLTRVLAQHRAHGGAHRPRSLNLKRVSPCHSSCTGRCTRFSNNQRARNGNWQSPCPPTLVDPRTTQCRSARTTAGYIHCPTEPLQCAQPVRIAARPLGNSRATVSRNCRNTEPKRAHNCNKNCVTMAAHDASQ